ncbi:hypothetical protein KIN20_001722 [Parelaphostrongylus tenuis]|uniref:Uncharacterized protein n=1 Tax=Parelaphostrongylus tenuis TaxID=148309 RepID=A0AAD5MFF8_PARTN|nr:hypothetical protein KIN20_001722 [Parelaphostrongylus tenuis]
MRIIHFCALLVAVVCALVSKATDEIYMTKGSDATTDPIVSNLIGVDQGSGLFPQCIPLGLCYSNDDCFGGQCIGLFTATCQDDSQCGGLIGACNLNTTTCDCAAGFMRAGFPTLTDALVNFCNVKNCTRFTELEDCFGLKCSSGVCICIRE